MNGWPVGEFDNSGYVSRIGFNSTEEHGIQHYLCLDDPLANRITNQFRAGV